MSGTPRFKRAPGQGLRVVAIEPTDWSAGATVSGCIAPW